MADQPPKAEKDFTQDVDKLLPDARDRAKVNPQAALDSLLALEKQTRQASDLTSTSRIITEIITIAKNTGDWALLSDNVLLLSKKHGQLKQAVTKMVQVVMGFLDEAPDLDVKLSVIETLRTVTEGKIFVEVERARVTRLLSNIRKEQGDIVAAADILCELQVETFGSMSRREKTEFILDQVALCIEKGDWMQANILSRKISTRYFSRRPRKPEMHQQKEASARRTLTTQTGQATMTKVDENVTGDHEDVTDLKLRYYEQQITLAKHDDRYLDACKHWRQVLDTEAVESSSEQSKTALQRVIYYVILAPYDNEQSDLLQRISRDVRNSQVPTDNQILKLFTVPELMRWPVFQEQYASHLCSSDIFSDKSNPLTNSDEDKQRQRWKDLRRRVIEHNVRVTARYYTRIQFTRLTELLDLSEDETEEYISDLVTSKTIFAKIDRPARLISFKSASEPDDVLNQWSSKMRSLLGLLERVDHLIVKEEMLARIQPTHNKVRA